MKCVASRSHGSDHPEPGFPEPPPRRNRVRAQKTEPVCPIRASNSKNIERQTIINPAEWRPMNTLAHALPQGFPRAVSLLLNIGHAIDHMFLLIFATAVASVAMEFGYANWTDL